MKNIIVTIKDNDGTEFSYTTTVQVSAIDYRTLQDYEMDEYDDAWDRLCAIFERMSGLPDDWYIDHIEF